MHVAFYGAVREVTGSMHMICSDEDRILLDCGMFQGRRKETDEKNRVLPFDPSIITNVVLSHAHIDHSGRIPLLTRRNFGGHVYCTRATADASKFLLLDSAHIQESDAEYLNYKTVRSTLNRLQSGGSQSKAQKKKNGSILKRLKHEGHRLNVEVINELIEEHQLKSVAPLYTIEDAQDALEFFEGIPYRHPVVIGKNAELTFYEAGHILGSAFSIIRIQENGRTFKIGYSGDVGRFGKPIIRDPNLKFLEEDADLDLLIMESTYGDRLHDPVQELKPSLARILNEAVTDRGGVVIIPAFAFGRTQELLYVLHELYNEKAVPRIPVYVDSPLATNITKVFGEHPEIYDAETHETFLEKGKNPFFFSEIQFVGSVEESMALNREEKPHIVIAASGMCEAGRVLHHLRYKMHNERHTILIVGYMARNTLGRRLLEKGMEYEASGRSGPAPVLKLLNKEYPLRAHVQKLGGFSAHGDKNDMLKMLKESNLRVKKIALVHGEEDQTLAFADFLRENGFDACAPMPGEAVRVK